MGLAIFEALVAGKWHPAKSSRKVVVVAELFVE
jgi:hypothetical protein